MQTCDSIVSLDQSASTDFSFEGRFIAAGKIWHVSSNSGEILSTLQTVLSPQDGKSAPTDLRVRIHVDSRAHEPRWRQPFFRALDHLYYAAFGPSDSMLVDQLNPRVLASFSAATAVDIAFWKTVVVPVLAGISSASVGVTPLHCSCVAKNGLGLLLAGESGAGKSTLALLLSLNGFSYLSDDCTYLSVSDSGPRAWGLPNPVKLLPDAVKYFPDLSAFKPALSLNGELAFEVDPVEVFGVRRLSNCEPRALMFMERTSNADALIERMSPAEMASRLIADLEMLPSCISDQYAQQARMIDGLVDRECWKLRHGLQPAQLVPLLTEFCERW
jgi:hypothetical protein